ncbi:hypothetical protein J1N35_030708 [Gossypium stocksii]|uniref:Uncharacterized protein n=1 Tax=Gossypium stocksii TaxID=47602 RepID=A0A9D3ZT57_9ROSI|nr:hypothetical protein J1N35_030708 [Gossypium stocksii]
MDDPLEILNTAADLHTEMINQMKGVPLYVSVDAATKDSSKAIDRPCFGDFWERFIDSLTALKEKQQQTVYCLTVVKGWNREDVDVKSIGKPSFVEIKTYRGSERPVKNQKVQGQCPIEYMVASGRPFNSEDYMALTPSWAIYGAEESRYYPNQSWHRKK